MAKRMGSIYNRKEGVLGFVYSNGKRMVVVQEASDCAHGLYLGELYLQEHDEQWRVGFSPASADVEYRHSRQINDLIWQYRDRLNR